MSGDNRTAIWKITKGTISEANRTLVREYPIKVSVNGRELATLVASPHQLNFLVAGFFRLQGFIDSLDDFQSLGICSDFGVASVRIRKEVPERLKPTLTSGCGTGIAFNLDLDPEKKQVPLGEFFPTESVTRLMSELARRAEQYRTHGGIHSAAVGDGKSLLLYAEDIGRHNTLDRIAGEALFKGIDLAGRMLVTSGRISTEMVAKAARLGIALIASRTSPTDMAVHLAQQHGITLIGYLRGDTLEVFSHRERLVLLPAGGKIQGVTGVILAGGESRRMGSDKSLLPLAGARFIDHIYRRLAALFDDVIIVTNSPELYAGIPCRKVPDLYYAQGSLAGIHSGLCHASTERIFVVACDMPFVSETLVRYVCSRAAEGDVVVPMSGTGLEPLHALYHKNCLPAVEEALEGGFRRIVKFFSLVDVVEVTREELVQIDPQLQSFCNINTPQEYFGLRETFAAPVAEPKSSEQERRQGR